jgi:hypothetical protein
MSITKTMAKFKVRVGEVNIQVIVFSASYALVIDSQLHRSAFICNAFVPHTRNTAHFLTHLNNSEVLQM